MDISPRNSASDSQRDEDPLPLIIFIISVWTTIFAFQRRTPDSEMQLVTILIILIAVVSHPRNIRQIPRDVLDCLERTIEGFIMLLRLVFMSRNQEELLSDEDELIDIL
ncbi:unnamed protein product [Caenorhabditis angaria]|uniref:Uncharacterized protein n=1 Tax=Caenorhabditis angaria TaxID=860376 RepID=A0A9P1I6Y5_9PELO|nr:unnamed protein product [Caenorhabditis angaria]